MAPLFSAILSAMVLVAIATQASPLPMSVGADASHEKSLPYPGLCMKARPRAEKRFQVKEPLPVVADIPRDWDWRNVNGKNFATSSRNQHIPQYCGSCWAMSSTSAFADRVRIRRRRQAPDFLIAVQTILHCVQNGCQGGDADDVYAYIFENGIGPDTCQVYIAQGTGLTCEPIHQCMNCLWEGNCSAITRYPKFYAHEYGDVQGVSAMKNEIYQRGPIACQVDANPIWNWGFGPNRSQIFTGGVGHTNIDHEISVVGFGFDASVNMDYWIIRNSWGEYWGEKGYFRLQMGNDQIGIESNSCSWAVPKVPSDLLPVGVEEGWHLPEHHRHH